MRSSWQYGEKEFLVNLHKQMDSQGLDWRDDAIVTPISENLSLLYSIDNVSIIKELATPEETMIAYGKWAASVICNDIIACGTLPKGLALDVGIGNMDEDGFNCFVKGVLDVCRKYATNYEGGNINTSDTVSGIAWGTSEPERIIRRRGAREGAVLFATTDIGIGWTKRLLRKYASEQGMSLSCLEGITPHLELLDNYQNDPCVNIELFKEIWDLDIIQCGMDLTDGIIELGYEIFDRTNLGVVFDFRGKVHPLLQAASDVLNYTSDAFHFEPGYDTPYAHGWCIDERDLHKAICTFEKYNAPYTILGYTSSDVDGVTYNAGNSLRSLPRYWDDKIINRGSIDNWEKIILPVFNDL